VPADSVVLHHTSTDFMVFFTNIIECELQLKYRHYDCGYGSCRFNSRGSGSIFCWDSNAGSRADSNGLLLFSSGAWSAKVHSSILAENDAVIRGDKDVPWISRVEGYGPRRLGRNSLPCRSSIR
jgi:hypothetical protein